MLFNSLSFYLFFPIVTLIYFLLPHRFRWIELLVASCVFYMFFIPQYILILFVTILIDYFAAIKIQETSGQARKWYLYFSIFSTCLVLFIFKYYNFFLDNLNLVRLSMGYHLIEPLKIILPIGLSFHTFQSLSYVIEVYYGRAVPERHFGIYSLYVMYYPQLVAGPIERPQNLLYQFREEKRFETERVKQGLIQMTWGLFKKVFIADRLSLLVNPVFDSPHDYDGRTLLIAAIFFSFQIYNDFSGYSDMALGTSKVMGIELMKNFNHPYTSTSVSDFWKRWHMSLSQWFRDYVYIPLGGNRKGKARTALNQMITFSLSGLWHGANWTFVVWGALNGAALIVQLVLSKIFGKPSDHWLIRLVKRIGVFFLVTLFWIYFRARNIAEANWIVREIFATTKLEFFSFENLIRNVFSQAQINIDPVIFMKITLASLAAWLIGHILGIQNFPKWIAERPAYIRWPAYCALIILTFFCGIYSKSQFIYFQF